MDFQLKCMFCEGKSNSPDYNCSCRSEMWTNRYRSIDIEIDARRYKAETASSFLNYNFHDKAGMLQYNLLPHLSQKSNKTVGLTPLHYLSDFSFGNNHLFLKDEGQNPSGCFKDRESIMCLLHPKAEELNNVLIYSSGNAAASAAVMLKDLPCRLLTFVPGDTYPEKIEYIRDHGSDVIVIGGENTGFEEGYRLFADMNAAHVFADNGFDNWSVNNPYRVQGDKTIAIEIVKQLSPQTETTVVPDYVIVPTANGSCLTGIWKGFKELYETGIIEKLPKMVSAGIKNASPVYKAVQQHKTHQPVRCDLSKTDDDDAKVGSIILAEEGYDSIQAADAVIKSDGLAVELHASDIRQSLIKFLKKENELALKHSILPEPASMTSLAALIKMKNELDSSKENIIVSVCTGHGLKARQKIDTLLKQQPDLKKTVEQIIARRDENMISPRTNAGTKLLAEDDLASVLEAFLELKKPHNHEHFLQSI